MKRPKTSSKKLSWFSIASVFLLAVTLAVGMHTNAQAATGSLDRDSYLPSFSDTSDYERAFITVTDSSITTVSTDTITVTVKSGSNSIPFVLKETGATTTVFTTTGATQPGQIGVGTTTGYAPDFTGSHLFPALGVSTQSTTPGITALNLKKFATQNGGDATTSTSGNLNVTAGDTLQLLYGGSTLDTAVVGYNGTNDSTITFTKGTNWGNSTTLSVDGQDANVIVTITDPDENLNPKLKDCIGIQDGFRAGLTGTASSRVQVEAIDQNNVDATLSVGGVEAVARNIMFIETGNNTGIFTAQGKIYGSTTSANRGNIYISAGTTTAALRGALASNNYAYTGSPIVLGSTTASGNLAGGGDVGVSFKIVEITSSGRIGFVFSGTSTYSATYGFPGAGTMTLAYRASPTGNFTSYGSSSVSSSRVVAVGTNTCAFGDMVNPTANFGTATGNLVKLIDGSDYCLVLIGTWTGWGDSRTIGTTTGLDVGYTLGDIAYGSQTQTSPILGAGSVTVTVGSFVLAGPRTGDTIKVSYLDEFTSSGSSGTVTAKAVFGTTGEAGTLSVDKTTADINDFIVVTVVDGNLNSSSSTQDSVASGSWGGTNTTSTDMTGFSRGDRLTVKAYNSTGYNGIGSNTVSISHPDGFRLGTQTIRISNSDSSLVWVVPTTGSALTGSGFGEATDFGSSTFSLGTQSTSSIPLVRGSSSTANSTLSGASTSTFVATTDAVDNTVEISPDGTYWVTIPVVETGVNSSTFIGTIGFDCTAARVTTNSTSTNATTIFTDYTGTSTISFQGTEGDAYPALASVFGTGSVVRITDGTFSDIREVTSVAGNKLSVTKMSNTSFYTPWKTWVQVIGNDMSVRRLDTVSGSEVFRIGGFYGATYRLRFNDASGASNAYLAGDTLAVTTSNVGFTTSTGSISVSPSGTVGLNSQIIVTLVDNDLNTSASGKQSTYYPEDTSKFYLNELGLGYPAGTSTGNAPSTTSFRNGKTAKDIFASNSSNVTSTNISSASSSNAVHIKLIESAVNSGTFVGTFQLSQSGDTTQSAIVPTLKVSNGETVTVYYNDSPGATTESNLTNFTTSSVSVVGGLGTLNLSKTEAFLSGDSVVATVVDNDLNTSATSLQSAQVIVTSSSDVTGSITVSLEETSANSATFKGTFKTGGSTDSTTSPKTIRAVANGTVTVKYQDAFPATDVTAQVSTKNFGAVLAFTADSVALSSNAVVSLYDPESNTSITSAGLVNVGVKSTTDSSGTTLRLTETGNDTGSFLGTIAVSTDSSLVNTRIKASVGDTLTATFTDNPDASGVTSVVTDTATVAAAAATPTPTPAPATPTPTPGPATPTPTPGPATPTPVPPTGGIITGTVVDITTTAPIAGATVSTDTGGYSAVTDPAGSYTIVDVAAGDYTVTASATGYDSSSQPVTVVAGGVSPANFALAPTIVTTPTPIVTPTPTVCAPESITAAGLSLKRKQSKDVTVTVNGDTCDVVEGETVTATINAAGKKRISISPTSASTDASGQATFTITAKKKTGSARVTFKAGSAKKSITVKVRK